MPGGPSRGQGTDRPPRRWCWEREGRRRLNDGIATALSFGYVLAVIGLAEGLRRARRVSFGVSRKIIHVGIGTWVVPTVLLFHSMWWAAAPPAVFVLLNALSYRKKWVSSMDEAAGSNLGTIFFPLAFVLLILALWGAEDGRRAIAAGILVLAWGDAAAALVGLRFGRHRYRVGSGWRSWEGSAAMLGFSVLGIAAAGWAVGPAPFRPGVALVGAVVATALEASSRRGLDNLLVPLGTSLLLWGLA